VSPLQVNDRAGNSVIGIVLMTAITLILAVMFLSSLLLFITYFFSEVPTVFEIATIEHTRNGILTYESYMVVKNIGSVPYDNRKLYARTYRNGKLLPCFIPTLNGNDFIPVKPYGIYIMGGLGCHDFSWYPGQTLYIDYNQGTFRPGDVVMFEVYDRETNQIVSRDIWPHTSSSTEKWMKLLFSRQGA
jgi:flagellin-like protein